MPLRQEAIRQGRHWWTIALAVFGLALAAPSTRANDPVIAAAGDIACDPGHADFNGGNGSASTCRQRYTSDLLVNAGLAAVLPLGDIQYEDGALNKFQASYDPSWGRVKSITRPAIGNHDHGSGYYDYFNGPGALSGPAGPTGAGYYSFDLGAWHLIALNTNCADVGGCHVGSPQQRWLEEDLARNPTSCTLAYWHESLFSSYRPGLAPKVLWEDLYSAGADLVLSGHSHNYERFAPQTSTAVPDPAYGLRQFVVGTGGRGLSGFWNWAAPNSEKQLDNSFGVLMVTLHPTSYEWQFVSETGSVEDSGSGVCHGRPPAGPAPRVPASRPKPPSKPSGRSTIPVSECTVVGTPRDDVLRGTRRADVICGFGGDDEIHGGRGDDVLAGDSGNDRVVGGAGNDRIYGAGGKDRLEGGSGRDRIYGGIGGDRLFGNRGSDRIADSAGNDRVHGNSGNDALMSSLPRKGRDLIDGGTGRDRASVSARDEPRRIERFFEQGRAATPPNPAHHLHRHQR